MCVILTELASVSRVARPAVAEVAARVRDLALSPGVARVRLARVRPCGQGVGYERVMMGSFR